MRSLRPIGLLVIAMLTISCAWAGTASAQLRPLTDGTTYSDNPDGTPGESIAPAPGPETRSIATRKVTLGQQDRAVIMCNFNGGDSPQANRTQTYYKKLWGTSDLSADPSYAKSLHSYFDAASYGAVNLNPTVSASFEQIGTKASYGMPYPAGEPNGAQLTQIAQDCVNVHDDDMNFSSTDGIDLILAVKGNDFGASGVGGARTLTLEGTGRTVPVTWMATNPSPSTAIEDRSLFVHEIGHSFNLPHTAYGTISANGSLTNPVSGFWEPMQFHGGWCFWQHTGDPSYGCSGAFYSGGYRSSDFLGWTNSRERTVAATSPAGGGTGGTGGTTKPPAKAKKCKAKKKKSKKSVARKKKSKCKAKKKKKRSAVVTPRAATYTSTTVTIDRAGSPPADGNPVFVKVPHDSPQSFFDDYYGVEVRNKTNSGLFEGETPNDGVLISLVRPHSNPDLGGFAAIPVEYFAVTGPDAPDGGFPAQKPFQVDPNLSSYTPGETWTSPDSLVTIEVTAATAAGFTVKITNRKS